MCDWDLHVVGKKNDKKLTVTISRPRIIPFFISHIPLSFRNLPPAWPTIQLNNHWVTSLEAICQITCSFLRSHECIWSQWFYLAFIIVFVICKQTNKKRNLKLILKLNTFCNKKLQDLKQGCTGISLSRYTVYQTLTTLMVSNSTMLVF